jgi:hypothetical protein
MDDRTGKPAPPGEDGKLTAEQERRAERDLLEANIRRELERVAAVGRRHPPTGEDPEITRRQTKDRPQR